MYNKQLNKVIILLKRNIRAILVLLILLVGLLVISNTKKENFQEVLFNLNNVNFIARGDPGLPGEDGNDGSVGPSGPAGRDGVKGEPSNLNMINNTKRYVGSFIENIVLPWLGTDINDIPIGDGWFLCDGKEYTITYDDGISETFTTPDLRGKFILGYGGSDMERGKELGEEGGEYTVTLEGNHIPSHGHSFKMNKTYYFQPSHWPGGLEEYKPDVEPGKVWKPDDNLKVNLPGMGPLSWWQAANYGSCGPNCGNACCFTCGNISPRHKDAKKWSTCSWGQIAKPRYSFTEYTELQNTKEDIDAHENTPPYNTLAYIVKYNFTGKLKEIRKQIEENTYKIYSF